MFFHILGVCILLYRFCVLRVFCSHFFIFFFFKQKTAYEIHRCWSSDVCSSDLRFLICAFFLLAGNLIQAQYKVTFYIIAMPGYQKENDRIYLAGSFNNWNPRDRNLLLDRKSVV